MNVIRIVSVVVSAFFVGSALAQAPVGGFAEMDAEAYRLDSNHAQVEMSYGIVYRTLAFTEDKTGWIAPIAATAQLWQAGKLSESRELSQNVKFAGTKKELESAGATKVVGTLSFVAPYGNDTRVALLWHFTGADGRAGVDSMVRAVALPEPDQGKFAISGVELASSVEKATAAGNPFEKVGYVVTPNPSDIFGDAYTKLYYYVEFYVPQSMVDPSKSIEITSSVQDATGKDLVTATRSQSLLASSIPFIGVLDVDGLPGDSYKLKVIVKKDGQEVARVLKDFYYDSGIKLSEDAPPSADAGGQDIYAGSAISTMTEQQIADEFEHAAYVARPDEKKQMSTLANLDAKRRYLFDFWRKRDKSGAKPLSEFDAFRQRVKEADEKFTLMKLPGWKSDRGRIWITYGPPDYISTDPFSPQSRPSILWQYNTTSWLLSSSSGEYFGRLKGTESLPHFVFVDRQGAGQYKLVHSNVQGETSEPDWYTREAKITN